MEDHYYASTSDAYTDNVITLKSIESENVDTQEKIGDDYLIELYRERTFLYDKSHRDFKNKIMKENAWSEISNIMQQKNLGEQYTPEYCQMRCTSLRNQYSREKRYLKNDQKSGSACSKRKTFPFFSQLSFLDNFIKRRKTICNIEKEKNILQSVKDTEAASLKNSDNESISFDESEQQIKVSQKRNISGSGDVENEEHDYNERSKKNASRFKKQKINKTASIDDTFTDISHAILNFLNTKENTADNIKSIDQSFADYIGIHLQSIPEPEKSIRKKKIFDVLTAPLPKT